MKGRPSEASFGNGPTLVREHHVETVRAMQAGPEPEREKLLFPGSGNRSCCNANSGGARAGSASLVPLFVILPPSLLCVQHGLLRSFAHRPSFSSQRRSGGRVDNGAAAGEKCGLSLAAGRVAWASQGPSRWGPRWMTGPITRPGLQR